MLRLYVARRHHSDLRSFNRGSMAHKGTKLALGVSGLRYL